MPEKYKAILKGERSKPLLVPESLFILERKVEENLSIVKKRNFFCYLRIQVLTIILPVFSPVKRPMKAAGILVKPCTVVSLTLISPEPTHLAMVMIPSTHLAFQRFTRKPSIFSSFAIERGRMSVTLV